MHTPTILHITHIYSPTFYPQSHINSLSEISVVSHCFSQALLWHLYFEFPLICTILSLYHIPTICLCYMHKKRRQAVAPKAAWIHVDSTQIFHLYAKLH